MCGSPGCRLVFALCGIAVVAAMLARIAIGWPSHPGVRVGALGALTAALLAMSLWMAQGPLGRDWAKRAGTPTNLLPASERGSGS